jgi:hypothetical protein
MITVWISDNFAEDWFLDALREAQTGTDHNAIRREIILAGCFLESYIFEWARRKLQIEEINDFFPPKPRLAGDPRYRRTLKDKWKQIPGELYAEGKIPSNPNLDLSGLGTLLKYRHGLVHAAGSRPATDSQPQETRPFPTKDMLKSLKPGWAVRIAVDLVTSLHNAIGDPLPDYVQRP